MTNLIIGTCGHIDHGKTSLIKALSGFEGDTTPEEKKRGITIDLSFSHLKSSEKVISFIDVPGHESLVKNMIAGAYGFDYALFVVSALEGIMPQSREHLKILELLGIKRLIVAVTKKDLVENPQDALQNIKTFLDENYSFEIESMFLVSIFDKSSIEELKAHLLELKKPKKESLPFFRMYIDRSFSIKGSGTVVSGTVLGGSLKAGEKLIVCDLAKEVGAKGIQKYGGSSESADSFERVALNLSNIEHTALQKGMLLAKKGYLRGFGKVDVFVKSNESLHNRTLFVHIGTKRMSAKLLELKSVKDGYLATLECEEPLFCVFGEKFVLRDDSDTLGGGEVLNPIADPIKKSQKIELLESLLNREFKAAFELLMEVHKKGFGVISSLQRFAIGHDEAISILRECKNIFLDEKELVAFPLSSLEMLKTKTLELIKKNKNALLSAKSLKERFSFASEAFCQRALDELEMLGEILQKDGLYISSKSGIKNIGEYIEESILARLDSGGIAPMAPYNIYDAIDIDRASGDGALKKLTTAKKVVRLEHNYFITAEHLKNALDLMRSIIKSDGYADVGNLKERANLSRKYAIALLEYLDGFGDIKKDGNRRIFKS